MRRVLLLGQRQVAEQPGGLLDADHQHPGGHRVERAGVPDPAGAGQPADPGHDVVRGQPGWLVDDQQPAGRASPRPVQTHSPVAQRRRSRRPAEPGAVNPAARAWPPPPSAVARAADVDPVLGPGRDQPGAVVGLLEDHGHLGLVGAPQHVDDRLDRRPAAAGRPPRSARVTVVQTRPRPRGRAGLEHGPAQHRGQQLQVAERGAVEQLAGRRRRDRGPVLSSSAAS